MVRRITAAWMAARLTGAGLAVSAVTTLRVLALRSGHQVSLRGCTIARTA